MLRIIVRAGLDRHRGAAPGPGRAVLVDVDVAVAALNDRGLVVLHVGRKADHAAHPGRAFTEEDVAAPHDMSNPKDMMLELPALDALRAKVASFGISDDSRIVVYFGKNGAVQSATASSSRSTISASARGRRC